ncbi:MAG: DUF2660 domain-containing protein [Rickettsia endosymbiont of Ixodes persulcatus]|nr:DUF2660 domain-containing protein [Rickettsia endosymbiont of Ixodes persulcatus]MCZ6903010.1 DUF2660 domain-containing protein [Rickettsia endosymbiont of Ixodes persulcatus]MCZ6908633.1 DUF2660 domain-containing protein [Rickettsia endosymbiont of Ixodes persulcatus]MCZ6910620.1 DUF2660 domain-containing protein [Rickettsia endosymbiont of Ixodes persulcatus]MCZ6914333.1 DUF2660 domain-containing protein [Rickettsia endosymbiont of Ixodes persulcatus]
MSNSNTHILIAVGCLALIVIFLIYKKIAARKKNILPAEGSNVDGTPNVALNSKKPENKKLTLQERIELSWKFLYDITEIILNKFSKEDVIQVNKCGQVLLENGVRYEHVVDLAIPQVKSHTQAVEQEQSKGKKALGV